MIKNRKSQLYDQQCLTKRYKLYATQSNPRFHNRQDETVDVDGETKTALHWLSWKLLHRTNLNFGS